MTSELRIGLALVCAALATTGMPACTVDQPGIEVPVTYSLGAPSPDELMETAGGELVILDRTEVTLGALELLPCDDSLAALLDVLGGARAAAHTEDGPLRIGVPVVMRGEQGFIESPGVMRPPPGRYCGARVLIDIPDEDALGAITDGSMAASVSGRYVQGEQMVPFSLQTSMRVEAVLPLPERWLNAAEDRVELRVTVDARVWLDGLRLDAPTSDDRVRLAEQVHASLSARWVD